MHKLYSSLIQIFGETKRILEGRNIGAHVSQTGIWCLLCEDHSLFIVVYQAKYFSECTTMEVEEAQAPS